MQSEPNTTRYLEDIEEGSTHFCGSVNFSRDEIIEFARQYDPLAIHTDPEAAAESRFDGIIASGYHTLLLSVRKLVEAVRQRWAVIAGIGMDNVQWHEPVRAGDTISVATTVVATEPSEGDPNTGVLHEEITVTNQFETTVLSLDCYALVKRRPSTRCESRIACNGWDNADCEGTPYCPPRCPRFEGTEGRPLLVRPYRPEDRRALTELYDGVDEQGQSADLPLAAIVRTDAWIDRVTSEGWNLVAFDGDRVVGHAAIAPDDSADPAVQIYVDQAERNRGIDSELVKQVIAYADGQHRKLTVDLSAANEGVGAVYRECGFDIAEKRLSELRLELDLRHSIVARVRQPPAARN